MIPSRLYPSTLVGYTRSCSKVLSLACLSKPCPSNIWASANGDAISDCGCGFLPCVTAFCAAIYCRNTQSRMNAMIPHLPMFKRVIRCSDDWPIRIMNMPAERDFNVHSLQRSTQHFQHLLGNFMLWLLM